MDKEQNKRGYSKVSGSESQRSLDQCNPREQRDVPEIRCGEINLHLPLVSAMNTNEEF